MLVVEAAVVAVQSLGTECDVVAAMNGEEEMSFDCWYRRS